MNKFIKIQIELYKQGKSSLPIGTIKKLAEKFLTPEEQEAIKNV